MSGSSGIGRWKSDALSPSARLDIYRLKPAFSLGMEDWYSGCVGIGGGLDAMGLENDFARLLRA